MKNAKAKTETVVETVVATVKTADKRQLVKLFMGVMKAGETLVSAIVTVMHNCGVVDYPINEAEQDGAKGKLKAVVGVVKVAFIEEYTETNGVMDEDEMNRIKGRFTKYISRAKLEMGYPSNKAATMTTKPAKAGKATSQVAEAKSLTVEITEDSHDAEDKIQAVVSMLLASGEKRSEVVKALDKALKQQRYQASKAQTK
jgi:hypothetical protein